LLIKKYKEIDMPTYVIEREIPGAGNMNPEELRSGAQQSLRILKEMGPQIKWVQSYVTDDKLYCVYIAPNKEMIEEHAERAGVPANRISEVRAVVDPATIK